MFSAILEDNSFTIDVEANQATMKDHVQPPTPFTVLVLLLLPSVILFFSLPLFPYLNPNPCYVWSITVIVRVNPYLYKDTHVNVYIHKYTMENWTYISLLPSCSSSECSAMIRSFNGKFHYNLRD